ncbi:hypothetical protein EXN66_Car005175 [Channa argus]|uniref:Tumor protein p53-inducible nuclear protein 2 n=1 Tax=Channa argus TaxID=215402 RepID=A0A6G1PH34_CHAAH|nr:hypothetical protein EXN66_Car005175 [Channa argus]KAK2914688.1 hypothetical protein Q8A73_005282 [Channa argus]
MFKTLTRLLFGGQEETPEVFKSGEEVDEGWLVVSHKEATSAENQDIQADSKPSNSAPHGDTVANRETNTKELAPEPEVQTSTTTSRAISGSSSQPKPLAKVTQSACIQKAKAWADRHHMSRNSIQRKNRIRQGVHPHSFYLQQPGHRNLSH